MTQRDTGGPPVNCNHKTHGRAAHATLQIRQGAYLPHWTLTVGGMYAVTYRLADSLPREVLERLVRERDTLTADAQLQPHGLTEKNRQRLAHLHAERIEAYLDSGCGACWLQKPHIADLVSQNLHYFAGQRYQLHAWCVMPNHVHVVVEPLGHNRLPDLIQSWKSFTAKAANTLLGRTGEFWQPEYYDHLIRDAADYAHVVAYVEQNPVKAGLLNWRWVSRGTGGSPVRENHETTDDSKATQP